MSKKIDLMIIGAQKAGTTSLKEYLGKHPQISTHVQTELSFFANDDEYTEGFDDQIKKYFLLDKVVLSNRIVAKHATLYTSEKSLRRLYAHNPKCFVVLVARNPVERAYSAYTMGVSDGWMNRSFDEISDILQSNSLEDLMYRHFVDMGNYAKYLDIIYSIFPEQQVCIVLFEELKADAEQVCSRLFTNLDLPAEVNIDYKITHNKTQKVRSEILAKWLLALRQNSNILKRFSKTILPYWLFASGSQILLQINKSRKSYKRIDPSMRKVLQEYYRPYNESFQRKTGISVEHWNL